MRVMGAGFGRTGTMSLKAALERLGCGPCLHMIDLIEDPSRVPAWQRAVDGERADWARIFDGFESTVDWPACSFFEELMVVFPEAKILLSVRDPDSWYDSAERTIYAVTMAAREGGLGEGAEASASPETMAMIGKLIWEGTFGGRFGDRAHAIRVYHEHNQRVIATVPPERLLVYRVEQGWEPLVEFLGAQMPEEPFPRLNDTEAFRQMVALPALGA